MEAVRHTDNLRQLAHVLALHECGDFGRAAERLGITKSALSQSLQRMEDIYGVPLFVRGRRKIMVTVYGEILVETARRTFRTFKETQRQIDLLRNLDAGRLAIACDPLLADSLLAPALLKIVAKYPRLEFNQRSGNWLAIQEDFRRGDLDIFLGLRPDQPIEGFQFEELELPPLKVYARPGHAIFLEPEPTLDDCWRYPILAAPVPDWYIQRIARGSSRDGHSLDDLRKFFLVSDSTSLIRDIICASDSISADFAASLGPEISAGRLKILDIASRDLNETIPAVIITPLDRALPPSAGSLAEAIKMTVAEFRREGT
ncbi:MAG: LysR family transcriptional regulator [Sphingomonadales bacterium]|nr:MAG: LysR family transcriptional regulator [Sphingomonadales bacterium]